jgi:chromosome segregation ATPase
MDSLVYVVSGLKEELEETQTRLKKTEENHAQFVDEVKKAEGNQGKISATVNQEQNNINQEKAERQSLKTEMEGIISRTEKLKTMSAKPGADAAKKEKEVAAVRSDFEAFVKKIKKADSTDAKNVLNWLKDDIAKQDDVNYTHKGKASTAGQYNSILAAMRRILNSI